jgi:histidine ammonia-lyase
VREKIGHLDADRILYLDIEAAENMIRDRIIIKRIGVSLEL